MVFAPSPIPDACVMAVFSNATATLVASRVVPSWSSSHLNTFIAYPKHLTARSQSRSDSHQIYNVLTVVLTLQ